MLRVLIVDDNRDAADNLGILIEQWGHRAHVVYGGDDAVAVISVFQPDVALLDIGMPDVDGLETARRIRALPEGSGIALAAVTGFSQRRDRLNSEEAGFDCHFVKPVDVAVLETFLRGILASLRT